MGMHTGERWRLGRRPGLDGLRGVAILLVLGGHAQLLPGSSGPVGVTVFFALSGFLITSLLLGERATTGRIRWVEFYRRRALRLFPVLACYVLVTGALTVVGAQGFGFPLSEYVPPIFYIENWLMAIRGWAPNPTSITWSLSVEEQFYLLWPLVIILGRRVPRLPLIAAAAGLMLAPVLRMLLWDGGAGAWRVYYGTDTRMDCLLLGCLLAVVVSNRSESAWWRWVWPAGVAAVALACTGLFSPIWMPTLVTAGACAMIAAVLAGGARWLAWSPLRWFGKRSYAMYLWHYPLVYVAARTEHQIPMWLAVGLSLLASELSWRVIETPFLRLKNRPTSTTHQTDSAALPAPVAVPSSI